MTSGKNNMDNKLDDQCLIMKYSIDTNKKSTVDKLKKWYYELTVINDEVTKTKKILKHIMVHNQHYSSDMMDPPNAQDTESVVLDYFYFWPASVYL